MSTRPPANSGPAGARLWRSLLAEYEFQEHELALLRAMVRTVDVLAALEAALEVSGPLTGSGEELRTHPALVEARQQRIVLARLAASLRLPSGEEEAPAAVGLRRPQRRGAARGAYRPRIAS